MIFSSDNWAGACDSVANALHGLGNAALPAYGNDPVTRDVKKTFCDIFEKDVAVFFVSTGSVANALALSTVSRPGGHVFCHQHSHILEDECAGPEFFTSGMKMHGLRGTFGKFTADTLDQASARIIGGGGRFGQPAAVSLTQATEMGTLYSPSEIAALADMSKKYDIPLHMDGARFANALVSLDCSPAEMTWKSGVDLLSFGGTKNGCWCAEAVVFFDVKRAQSFRYIQMRAGQNVSKARFISGQFKGYFEGDIWIKNAQNANGMAAKLASGISQIDGCRVPVETQANEIFPVLPKSKVAALREKGAVFYEWPDDVLTEQDQPGPDETFCRLVTSFATTEGDVDRFLEILASR